MLDRVKLAGMMALILLLLIPAVLISASESSPTRPRDEQELDDGNNQFRMASAGAIDEVVV